MTGGIGIFRTEGRSKGVNIAECLCKGLAVQLSTDSQIRLFSKEILAVIHISFLIQRGILHIQCGHLEHLSGAFTVASCNQRCVYINKASLLEKLMNGIRTKGAHTEHCLESIGTGTQMRHGS